MTSELTFSRPFSHSSLSSFEKCPSQFRFYYLDEIKKPQDSIEAFVGKRVHEALEFLYREVLKGSIPTFDAVLDFYNDIWESKWHDQIVFVNRYMRRDEYRPLGDRSLSWYYRKYHPFNEPVVGVEEVIEFNLGSDENYPIKGVLDRLQHDGDGKWEIHDYKTSKRRMSQAAADKDRQLALYHLGLKQLKSDVEDVRLVWHFVRTGDTVEARRDDAQLEMLENETKQKIDTIRETVANGGPFRSVQTPLCNWCYYWEECPAKRTNNPFVK